MYARYFNHDDFGDTMDGHEANDKWDVQHGGFRIDWNMSAIDSLVFKGDFYDGDANELVGLRSGLESRNLDFSGGNLLARWEHVYSDTSEMSLQVYYDRTYRDTELFREERNTFDLDFQHSFALGSRHKFVWGLGYRFSTDGFSGFTGFQLDPSNRGLHLFSTFLQNEVAIIKDLKLIFGTKLEHNDYTGLEVMPSAKILWTPFSRHTAWAAVTRAVKIPSRAFRDSVHTVATFPLGPGRKGLVQILGTPDIESEKVYAYELGYRFQPIERLSIDIATFYNNYYDLQTGEEKDSFKISPTETVFPIFNDNEMHGDTYGFEISADWDVTEHWKLKAGYTFLQMQLHLNKASISEGTEDDEEEGLNSRNRAYLLSYLNLPHNIEVDTSLYYVDHLSTNDIPSYLRLDMRLGWKPTEFLDISFGVKNMLDGEHREFPTGSDRLETTELERSIYGRITFQF
ncbi:MAG: TonB-dependent receptor [Candidatus Scalinduaceae bacterium]